MFVLILFLFTAYIVYYYIQQFLDRRNGPPGPMPLPIIGNLHNLAMASNVPHLAIPKLAEGYDDIFRIKIGSKDMFILTSIETIQTIFGNDDACGRDLCGTILDRNLGKQIGIVFSEGALHNKVRTWTIRNLRDYGFGKTNSMERIISQETESIIKEIEEAIEGNKGILQMEHAFILPVFKVAWQMIQGQTTTEDDIAIKRLLLKSEEIIEKGVFGAGLVNAFPFLRFIFPEYTGHNVQMKFYEDCYQTAKELLKTARSKLNHDEPAENFIQAYVRKMEEEAKDPQTVFTEENFLIIFVDLLQASSDTNNSFMQCLMLYTVLHPDVQEKLYEEIQRCIPEGRDVEFADKKEMIYTQAFFLEAHRHGKVLQNLIPRKCLQDIKYKDFVIKKGTVMMADLTTANNSLKVWDDPESFKPERFIENGQLCNQNKIVPFGNGKRHCPGEVLASATYFLFYVNILRKYKLSQVPRQIPPRADLKVSFSSRPYPFEVLFTRR